MDNAGPELIEAEPTNSLKDILINLDEKLKDKEGIKPSQAWRYREEVKAKYHLPECGYMWSDPERYIKEAEKYAKAHGIQIRPKHEFQGYFGMEEHRDAEAVSLSENVFRNNTVVVARASQSDWYGLRRRAKQFAHELVHAIQGEKYPRMPLEKAEREAYYYQMLTPHFFIKHRDNPDFVSHYLNTVIPRGIKSSCEIARKSEEKKE